MNGKIWMCLLALVVLLGNGAVAQEHGTPGKNQGKAELRQELRAYQQQTIAPFLKAQRKELDKKLSKADKRELADIRQQLVQHRQNQLNRFRQLKAEHRAQQSPLTEEQKAAFKEARAKQREQMIRLADLAKRNQRVLADVADKVNAQREKWRSDLQAIAAKHTPAAPDPKGHHQRWARLAENHEARWNAMRFLLMNPDQPESYFQSPGQEQDQHSKENDASSLQLHPNPVSDKTTLVIPVAQAGDVRVEVIDQRGQVVQQLPDRKIEAGKHTQTVQLNALQNGIYFFRVTTPTGTETVRFLKQ